MASLSSSDVTYSVLKSRNYGTVKENLIDISFGGGDLAYPSGGVPLLGAQLGFVNEVEAVEFVEDSAGDGYVYKWDQSTNKIRIYQGDYSESGDTDLVEFGTSDTPGSTTIRVLARGF